MSPPRPMLPPLDMPEAEMPEALHEAGAALQRIGTNAGDVAWDLLKTVQDDEASLQQVSALKKEAGIEGDEIERLLLWHASRQSLPRVGSLAVDKTVRERLDQDLRQLHMMKVPMTAGSYHFNRAAKMATLRRFPAGPMEWELSGIPRSFFLQASFPANVRLLAYVAFRLQGRSPCFFMHVAPAPRNRALSIPKQVLRSYYSMARSLQLQPNVRALVGYAWFHDPAAVRDYPHLEVLNRPYVEHGGYVVLLGAAPASSGVLEGNAQRKADYMSGKVRYNHGLAIWPRDAAIGWADAHPEFGE